MTVTLQAGILEADYNYNNSNYMYEFITLSDVKNMLQEKLVQIISVPCELVKATHNIA